MDQEKIGKLIAKLRKSKGLTQRELGDMVGVGFRAVSKWETGLTSPDISIINDLSKILGISADELLKGELNEKILPEKSKINIKNMIYIIIILSVIISSIVIVIVNRNKTYVYEIGTPDKNYYIEGELIHKNNNISIKINKLGFEDKEFYKKIITNYQYEITYNKILIVGYGYIPIQQTLPSPTTIKNWSDNFKINYNGNFSIGKKSITKSGFNLKIIFLDDQKNEIIKNIKIKLKLQK